MSEKKPPRPATIIVNNVRWAISDLDAVLADYDQRPQWRWLLGCSRCHEVCTHVTPCKCCQMDPGVRPYTEEAAHDRILAASEFAAKARGRRAGGSGAALVAEDARGGNGAGDRRQQRAGRATSPSTLDPAAARTPAIAETPPAPQAPAIPDSPRAPAPAADTWLSTPL